MTTVPILSVPTLRSYLDAVTYKPGWSLEIVEHDHLQGPELFINAWVPNSYYVEGKDKEEHIELRIFSHIPPMYTQEEFFNWLMWRLKQVEIHEVMEWFKVDNECYIDPHRPL